MHAIMMMQYAYFATGDESKIKPYDDYVKNEKQKLIKDEITKYLNTIITSAEPKAISICTDFSFIAGAANARDELVDYLIKTLEE